MFNGPFYLTSPTQAQAPFLPTPLLTIVSTGHLPPAVSKGPFPNKHRWTRSLSIRIVPTVLSPQVVLYRSDPSSGSFLPIILRWSLFKDGFSHRSFLHRSFSTEPIPHLDRFYRSLLYRAPFLMRVVSTNRSHCNSRFPPIRSLIRMFSYRFLCIDLFTGSFLHVFFQRSFCTRPIPQSTVWCFPLWVPIPSRGSVIPIFFERSFSTDPIPHIHPICLCTRKFYRSFSNGRFLPIRSLIGVVFLLIVSTDIFPTVVFRIVLAKYDRWETSVDRSSKQDRHIGIGNKMLVRPNLMRIRFRSIWFDIFSKWHMLYLHPAEATEWTVRFSDWAQSLSET